MKFIPKYLDFERSPYTGLSRKSWIQAGEFLLEGMFRQIANIEEPLVVERMETEISYPHLKSSPEQQERERKAEIFEALTRSFFIASVLLHENPELALHGIPLLKYYKKHILRVVSPGDSLYVGSYSDMQKLSEKEGNPFKPFQQTVESCALVIGLYLSEGEIWKSYTKEEQDKIAAFLRDWAESNTVPQNWRLFNMLDLAFLYRQDYEISESIMLEHAQAILDYYVGNGWYRDGESFDYYSCWAFNVYAPLWCLWYGYEKAPDLALAFEKNSNELMKTYPDMFDRDGWVNMWGRSCIYRNAASSAFDGNLFLRNSKLNLGRARQIASGSLLQFLGREDVFSKGVPGLGFYRQFSPLVQGYSCAESPFWLGKAFLCLHLPAEHPFWTEKENLGSFEEGDDVKETLLEGPGLCFSNHRSSGETILRSGKVKKQERDLPGMWNYGKLCYNTKFPWEAAVSKEIEAQQYVLESELSREILRGNVVFYCGQREGVLYRRQFFDFRMEEEMHWFDGINLADFPVKYGIFRADKIRLNKRPCILRLGSYGFPDNRTEIFVIRESEWEKGFHSIKLGESLEREKRSGEGLCILLRGRDSQRRPKQMAMTIYDGWESLSVVPSHDTNPDSVESIVLVGKTEYKRHYDAEEPHVLLSQVLTRDDMDDFMKEDLFPLEAVEYEDVYHSGAYGKVWLRLKNGEKKILDYSGMERNMSL